MKPIQTLKVSVSGIRAVVGDTLDPELVCRFCRAFATYLGPGTLVLGRDTRTSGEMVSHAAVAGLLASGMRVVDVGVCPVPTIQLAVRNLRARGGIALTASHNPAEWNALKFIKRDGCFLNPYEASELLALYHQREFRTSGPQPPPLETYPGAVQDHLDRIRERLAPASEPPLTVAVDCCNGAGAVMTPRLLESLGCRVVELNCRPDGRFPRPPEPLPANLEPLCRLVRESGADLGFAQDADADRLAVVSEEGVAIGEEYTLAMCTRLALSRQPGPVVVNLSTSRMIEAVAEDFGCPVHRSPIGEVHVTETMRRVGAVIGGEGNGGVIHPGVNLARDSFVAMTMILELIRTTGQPVSRLVSALPGYRMEKLVLRVHPHRVSGLIGALADRYRGERINREDGLKIEREDGWIHLRPSNTEPILRLVVEASDDGTFQAYREEFERAIRELTP